MAIQRTAPQKLESEVKERIHLSYVLPKTALQPRETGILTPPISQAKLETRALDIELFGYSASLIYRDIVKTLVVTTLTIGILVGLVFSGWV